MRSQAFSATRDRRYAHPHVFADARLEVDVAPDGHVEVMRHVWRFDEVFSSTVTAGIRFRHRQQAGSSGTGAGGLGRGGFAFAEFGYFQTILGGGESMST
jgi:ABC-type uncharacterized transport system substrate-binding protein